MKNLDIDLRLQTVTDNYRKGTYTPRTLIGQLRDKAKSLNSEICAFIHILTDDELEPYFQALDKYHPTDLPLYGIPFAIKDNINLAGIETTAGCPDFAFKASSNATIVQQLVDLGAIPLGKTNLDQFATGLNGTRSPFGACHNSVLPNYPSGGSSSGSALSVALGITSFALGTDTAGSGRVPASLNNLIGLKATKGLISTFGVVPACRTLDCVTFFTHTASEASQLLALTARLDPLDDYSRCNPIWNDENAFGTPEKGFRFGLPMQLEFFGCKESQSIFKQAKERLISLGGIPIEIDFTSFLEAARLLYEGPWIAERYNVAGTLIEKNPEAVLPVIHRILSATPNMSAVDTFTAFYQLQHYKRECDKVLAELECILIPTYPKPVTLQELSQDPIKYNSELGYYTNFMNLLDYAAVTVPAGFLANGLPSGITLFGRAFTDQYLLSIAHAFNQGEAPYHYASNDKIKFVVCGAHMQGMALNHQLQSCEARLMSQTTTAPSYRLFSLKNGTRPGLIRDEENGREISVEVWEMPASALGTFLARIPQPLGLGKVEMTDGKWLTGFICEQYGLLDATEITNFCGWKQWLNSHK